MSKYTKYKLYQKYETRGSQEAIPCYPNVFSIDGDGTMPLVIVEENSRDCGYTGDTQPIYRWYTMPITSYYVCDECDSQSYESQYLTLVAKGDGMFQKVNHSETFQYSKDEGNSWTNATSATTIYVRNGDRVMFKGTLTPNYSGGVGNFSASITFEAEGNPMSLLFGDNFIGKTSLSGKDYAFEYLFNDCALLTSVDNLKLVATALSVGCYRHMFDGCTSLVSGVNLPSTTLANECYAHMYRNCTSLTAAPNLPATTLDENCYHYMFQGCTSLTTAPELPATTLASGCYTAMFEGCTSLSSIPNDYLLATTLASGCYNHMFHACTSLTTLPQLPATTLAHNCYAGMFMRCTSITAIPNDYLPATSLTNYCYQNMFYECTSLASVPSNLLRALVLSENCYQGMFYGCTSLSAAPDLLAVTLTSDCYNNMFYGCSSLNYIKCLATDISATNCTYAWVYSVSSSGTFVKSSSMSGWSSGDDGIPNNWSVQNA